LSTYSPTFRLADEEIAKADKGKDLKYKRQANRSRAVSKLRELFFEMVTEPEREKRIRMYESLIAEIAKYPLPIVPGRSPLRKKPRKKRFYMSKKSVV
jgi:hypothetical protein